MTNRMRPSALAFAVCILALPADSGLADTSTAPAIAPATSPASTPETTAESLSPDQKFERFLHDFRSVAIAAGISPAIYDEATANIARNPKVEQLNLQQPEFTVPVWTYLDSMVSDRRIARGQEMLMQEAGVLGPLENKYGIPREILVAIWGDESNYGEEMGSFNMFEALATLAFDGPRAEYARRELIAALKMAEKEHYNPADMTSSWAGAFGQTQFVPSSFLTHAVDGDGDRTINMWTSPADALASTAALLADAGWQRGARWGYEVVLPSGFDYGLADVETLKSVGDWKAMGVTTAHGAPLPTSDEPGAIYLPAGARGPAFLVFGNFKVVLKYNNAGSYALAVCTLADRLRGESGIVTNWPRDEQPLAPDERLAFQSTLKSLGFDPGSLDGVLGHGTRAALRAWQKAHGLAADGFPTKMLLARLMEEAAQKH